MGKSIHVKRLVLGMVRTNSYIIYNDNKEALFIDPADDLEKIVSFVEDSGLVPQAILLTHGHFDHVMIAKELSNHYGIKIYAHSEEKDVLESSELNLSRAFRCTLTLSADEYIYTDKDGCATVTIGAFDVKVIHTPGHTKGSCVYIIDGEMFSGDTLFDGTYGRTDFPTGSAAQIIRSIKERLLVLDDDMNVYPGHNDFTTIGREKAYY